MTGPIPSGDDAGEILFGFCQGLDFQSLPQAVVDRTKLAVLDTLAASMAGIRDDAVARLSSLVAHWGGTPEATLLTNGRRVPLPAAGLVNGSAGRAVDLDDVHEQLALHLNVNTVIAALSVSEARAPVGGAQLIAAIAAGSEAMCRIACAPRISFSESGSAMSYQLAFYAAALAASKLMGLDFPTTLHALGIAHARVAGNHQGYLEGASTVQVMQGVAIEGGLACALMAERGLTGSSRVLEGRYGYYDVYQRGRYERSGILEGLGERWLLLDTSIKPLYPCCKFTHAPIAALLQGVEEMRLRPDDIEEVEVSVTSREVFELVCTEGKWDPRTISEARFSMAYVLACAAVKRRVGLESFSGNAIADPEVRLFMPRVRVRPAFGGQQGRFAFPMPGVVRITERSSRVTEWRVDHVKGHPKVPMGFDEVKAKFLECAAHARPGWRGAADVVERVRCLESLADAGELVRLCSAADTLS